MWTPEHCRCTILRKSFRSAKMEFPPNTLVDLEAGRRVAAAIGFAVLTTIAMSACSRNTLAAAGAVWTEAIRQC
jgi:hypothetical protein